MEPSWTTSRVRGRWTHEEDSKLREAVQTWGGKNWKEISKSIPGRSDVQCLHRWRKVLRPGLVKGPWTKKEDELVRTLVAQYGQKRWSVIATHLNGRLGKQCRERWFNHLNPDIKKGAWTADEDRIIIAKHQEIGNRWADIAKELKGRTDNSVKNRWNSTLKRLSSKGGKALQQPQQQQQQQVDVPVAQSPVGPPAWIQVPSAMFATNQTKVATGGAVPAQRPVSPAPRWSPPTQPSFIAAGSLTLRGPTLATGPKTCDVIICSGDNCISVDGDSTRRQGSVGSSSSSSSSLDMGVSSGENRFANENLVWCGSLRLMPGTGHAFSKPVTLQRRPLDNVVPNMRPSSASSTSASASRLLHRRRRSSSQRQRPRPRRTGEPQAPPSVPQAPLRTVPATHGIFAPALAPANPAVLIPRALSPASAFSAPTSSRPWPLTSR